MPNVVASNSTSFRNFAQKSKIVKRLHFRNEKAFLEKLDGKVYATCDKNGHYLCDVIEEDYLRLVDAGVLINLDDNLDYTLTEADCNYMITLDLSKKGYEDFKDRFGLFIDIDNERQIIHFNCGSINYEIDSLVLKSSTDESETSFVFMDGIAVQIESLESLVPVPRPIILTYPHKKDVFNSVRMLDEIEDYRGHSWDGDYYSIALLYGKERMLKNIIIEFYMENCRDIIKSEFKYFLANVARSARRTSEGFNLGKTAVDSFVSFLETNKLFDYNPEKWSHIESMYDITNPEKVKQIADDLLNDKSFIKHDNEKNQGWRSGAISHYVCFINARSFFRREKNEANLSNNIIKQPLQQIFYGAPGTGKSHKIKDDADVKEAVEKNLVFRTTFHPDSDYSTFVGCYKPTKAESKRLQRMNLSLEDLAKELGSYYTNEEFGKIGGIQKFCFEYYPYIDGEYMSVNITKLLELAGVPKDYNVEINKYIKFCHLLPKQEPDKIIYEFVPQAFSNAYVKAWNTDEEVYLIIEEINRGNCAQIFGDLFQLLDRKNGVSEYPVEADTDLQNYLCNALADTKRTDIPDDVKSGKKLMLPSTLYIWATMNTSDQSLFPIDSAFKRRWEWKYIKIKEGKDENGNKLDWKVDVKMDESGTLLYWWDFIKKINEIIASMTSSADKQLGYFFCCAKDGVIDEETFVSKVIFYLWNDVFKDYGFEDASLFRYTTKDEDGKDAEKDLTFPDFYDEEGENVNTERLTDFVKRVMSWRADDKRDDDK